MPRHGGAGKDQRQFAVGLDRGLQYQLAIMTGLVPGIHVLGGTVKKTWMAGTSRP